MPPLLIHLLSLLNCISSCHLVQLLSLLLHHVAVVTATNIISTVTWLLLSKNLPFQLLYSMLPLALMHCSVLMPATSTAASCHSIIALIVTVARRRVLQPMMNMSALLFYSSSHCKMKITCEECLHQTCKNSRSYLAKMFANHFYVEWIVELSFILLGGVATFYVVLHTSSLFMLPSQQPQKNWQHQWWMAIDPMSYFFPSNCFLWMLNKMKFHHRISYSVHIGRLRAKIDATNVFFLTLPVAAVMEHSWVVTEGVLWEVVPPQESTCTTFGWAMYCLCWKNCPHKTLVPRDKFSKFGTINFDSIHQKATDIWALWAGWLLHW